MTHSVTAPHQTARHRPGNHTIVVGGLAVGGALGFTGNFVGAGAVQDVLYAISAVGLILAATLLALAHAAAARPTAAAGFALLALGESRVLNPTGTPGGEASFAAGVMLYAPALLLVALSSWAPRWVRMSGAIAAIPFAVHALAYFGGASVATDGPIASVGYTLLTLTVVGWIVTVLRETRHPRAAG